MFVKPKFSRKNHDRVIAERIGTESNIGVGLYDLGKYKQISNRKEQDKMNNLVEEFKK